MSGLSNVKTWNKFPKLKKIKEEYSTWLSYGVKATLISLKVLMNREAALFPRVLTSWSLQASVKKT